MIGRHRFLSLRVSDAEYRFIAKAKEQGLSPDNLRDLVLFGAQMFADAATKAVVQAGTDNNRISGGS